MPFTRLFHLDILIVARRRKKCCHPVHPGDLFKYMSTLIKISNHLALILPCMYLLASDVDRQLTMMLTAPTDSTEQVSPTYKIPIRRLTSSLDGSKQRALSDGVPNPGNSQVRSCDAPSRVLWEMDGTRDVAEEMEGGRLQQSSDLHQVCQIARNAGVPSEYPGWAIDLAGTAPMTFDT